MAAQAGPTIDDLVAAMTLGEKVSLVGGRDLWHTNAVERLGIASIKVTDGPNGARGDGLFGTGSASLCIPCGSALGATWNPPLVEELGRALADQARTKGAHVLLAPTVNIHRTPLGGRNFECYSEDPYLSALLATGFVRGVQSGGVGTTVKHLVGNDSEFERDSIDSIIDERALREIYLAPFETVVAEAEPWGIMSAYNRLNGDFCAENERLLTGIVKGEWGFDGVVVSDWYGARSTIGSALGGLDLEMPGPPTYFGADLIAAVADGEVDEAVVDDKVRRVLGLIQRTWAGIGASDAVAEGSVDRPEHRSSARRAAAEATVLLSNDGLLPLDTGSITSLALIGPNAGRAQIMGGGSAGLRPHHRTAPLDAVMARLGDRVVVRHERGCSIDRSIPAITGRQFIRSDGLAGLDVEIFADEDLAGEAVLARRDDTARLLYFGPFADEVEPDRFSLRATTTFTPVESGRHTFSLVQAGRARVLVDDEVVLDGMSEALPPGDALFGMGSAEAVSAVELAAGRPVEVVIEYSSRDSAVLRGAVVGWAPPESDDLLERAVVAAAACDVAIVVVGTNDDWETEGRDRTSIALPGDQDELVRRVAAANPRTVVVVNAGAPVAMPWVHDVGAVLVSWFGGQEMADALVDVLTGEVSPSGKLPTTFPRRLVDTPAYTGYPGENGKLRYGESVFVGYRWYDARMIEPLFCFGHGLSYTTFELGAPDVVAEAPVGDPVTVSLDATNAGERSGAEVVQCYVHPVAPRLARPPAELKAFAKVELSPGETRRVSLVLDGRAFAYYDPGDPGWQARDSSRPVPSGGGAPRRSEAAWVTDAGDYELRIGVSSRDIRHTVPIRLVDGG